MVDVVMAGGAAAAGVDVDVVQAAAEQVRREVLALNELGARHAELNGQIRLLTAERDTVANEYQARYRQLAGGGFMNSTLRQLGMGRSLGGPAAARRRRPAMRKHRAPAQAAS